MELLPRKTEQLEMEMREKKKKKSASSQTKATKVEAYFENRKRTQRFLLRISEMKLAKLKRS